MFAISLVNTNNCHPTERVPYLQSDYRRLCVGTIFCGRHFKTENEINKVRLICRGLKSSIS